MVNKEAVYKNLVQERERRNIVLLDLTNDLEKTQQCKYCKANIHCEIYYVFTKPLITNVCCEKQFEIQIQKLSSELIKELETIPRIPIDFDKNK